MRYRKVRLRLDLPRSLFSSGLPTKRVFWFFIWGCDWAKSTFKTLFFSCLGATDPKGPGPPHYRVFTITLRHTTIGRTPLGEWSSRHRDLCLTTHNTHKRVIHASGGIRTPNPSKRAAADPRHWDRPIKRLPAINSPKPGLFYCVSGYSSVTVDILVFQRVGCDLKIGSMKKVDSCGVCGGDGQSCAQPLYHWEEAAMSLCSATCGGG